MKNQYDFAKQKWKTIILMLKLIGMGIVWINIFSID